METTTMGYMGGCQNHGPVLGTLNTRCRIIVGIQKGTIILTTTHAYSEVTMLRGIQASTVTMGRRNLI